jgi:hypothetical protein
VTGARDEFQQTASLGVGKQKTRSLRGEVRVLRMLLDCKKLFFGADAALIINIQANEKTGENLLNR